MSATETSTRPLIEDNSESEQKAPAKKRPFVVALIFTAVFVSIPWQAIHVRFAGYEFIDRGVYLKSISENNLRIDYYSYANWLDYFTEEYAWGWILNQSIRIAGNSPETVFFCMSFFTILIFSYYVAKFAGYGWLPLLINPLVVDLAFSQLRIALAMSLMITVITFLKSGYTGRFSAIRTILFIAIGVVATSIHTASILFFLLFLVALYWNEARSAKQLGNSALALVSLMLAGMAISLATGPLRGDILTSIGDRRAEYHDMSSSPLYLFFWVALCFALVIDWKHSKRYLETRFSIAILAIIATNLLTMGYSTRFIAASFPFIVVSLARMNGRFYSLTVLAYLVYAFAQWVFWLNLI